MTIEYDHTLQLTGTVRCILRDIARAIGVAREDLPGKFDSRVTAKVLELTTTRTLDAWAARPGRQELPFIKIGRSRRYLLTDVVAFIAKRHSNADMYAASAVDAVVAAEVARLGSSFLADAA